jgi:hypothetical protein
MSEKIEKISCSFAEIHKAMMVKCPEFMTTSDIYSHGQACNKMPKYYIGIKLAIVIDGNFIEGLGCYVCPEHLPFVMSKLGWLVHKKYDIPVISANKKLEILEVKF